MLFRLNVIIWQTNMVDTTLFSLKRGRRTRVWRKSSRVGLRRISH